MAHEPLKRTVREHLVRGDLDAVADLATRKKRVLGSLVALTFDGDVQVVWRAIEAMGMAVEKVAATHKAYAKEHMRRLYWLITEESGGVFWRAPECMAECCVRLPVFFQNHIPIAFHLLETLEEEDLEHFRPGALWAIGRLVDLARPDLQKILPLVVDALDRPDSQARGMAIWCLGEVGETQVLDGRPDLLADQGPVLIYRNRFLEETTVGRLAQEVMAAAGQKA
jgi:AraC family transcriptional regulator of adaptative response/methylated-DNA-[protein]-cysteine methyltransferase